MNAILDTRDKLKLAKRIVVKVGSSLLASIEGGLDHAFITPFVNQLANLKHSGKEIVLVTSGAVAAGCAELKLTKRPTDLPSKQAAAAVGQGQLMHTYHRAFQPHHVTCGQVLITRDIFTNRSRYLHAKNTFDALLRFGVVPIVNENDTVAVEELKLKVGDNDTIAMIVALLIHADVLILLTDVNGLYDRNPSEKGATLIERVDRLMDVMQVAGGATSKVGTGGMATKLSAAKGSHVGAIPLVIAAGKTPDILHQILNGDTVGTFFAPASKRKNARQGWIATSPVSGVLTVDDGASVAIVQHSKSLLPAGVKHVEGTFQEGDIVSVNTMQHVEIARGISNFSADDIRHIAGKKSADCAKTLGLDTCPSEIIHKDNLVTFHAE